MFFIEYLEIAEVLKTTLFRNHPQIIVDVCVAGCMESQVGTLEPSTHSARHREHCAESV